MSCPELVDIHEKFIRIGKLYASRGGHPKRIKSYLCNLWQ